MKTSRRTQSGISLVEVLVSIIVFAIGLLAIAALQGQLVRGSSDAKTRTVAASLAEQQFEQFRSFFQLGAGGGGYGDIVGRAEGDALTESLSGVDYERWWEVDEYYFPDGGGTALLGANPATGSSDFKMVRMHIAWTDESGQDQEVVVEDLIAAAPPSDSLMTVRGSPPPEHPIVRYKDLLSEPEVVQFDLGDGTSRQTSRPEPEIVGEGPNILTRFDTITFSNALLDGFPVQIRREEFLSVNCRCTQDGPGGAGRTPAQWDGLQWNPGIAVTKRTGTTLAGLDQPFICDRCCRDHHDATDEQEYDPFRPSGDDANGNPFFPAGLGGDHGHFNFDEDTGQLVPADANDSEYLEACTFTRVEGIFQVTSDFKLENVLVVPTDFLQTSANIQAFRDFVVLFVEEYVASLTNQYPDVTPNFDMSDPANNDASATLDAMWAAFPDTMAPPTSGDTSGRQLLARGLYINFINDELRNRIDCRGGGGTDCDDRDADGNPVLPLVPFQEINITRLATWGVDDTGQSSIFVTQDSLTTTNEDTFNRGRVIHCASYTPTDGSGTVAPRCDTNNTEVTARIFPSNTGLLANANAIDTDDAVFLADSITVDFDQAPPPVGIVVKGTFSLHPSVKGVELSNVSVAGSSGILCTRPEPTKYSCVFENGTTGGTIAFGNYNSVDRQGNVNNNLTCPTGVILDDGTTTVTGLAPVGDGTATETTPYSFTMMPDDEEYLLDIQINKTGC